MIDDIDNLLLAVLRKDARASTVALAQAIGLSRSATQARLQKLIANKIITGFSVIESTHTAQAAYFQVKLKSGYRCAQLVPKLKKLSGVLAIHSVAGEYDIVLRVEGPTANSIQEIRSEVVEMQSVQAVTTMMVMERHLN